jgi:hypothetical protein
MTAHYYRGAYRWLGEEILEEFADNGGLSDADGARRYYSSWL